MACLGLQGWPTSPCGDILGKVKAPSIPVLELSAGERRHRGDRLTATY